MAFGVDIELRRREAAIDQIGFQLGQVDAVGGETAERLVERGGHAADPEDGGGHTGTVAGRRHHALAGHDQKAGGVVLRVLHAFAQDFQTIDLGGQLRADGGDGLVAQLGDGAGGTGGIGMLHRAGTEFGHQFAGLGQRVDMGADLLHVRDFRAGHAEQHGIDALVMLADDIEAGFGQQVMDIRHTARDGILHRHHGAQRVPVLHRVQHVLKA